MKKQLIIISIFLFFVMATSAWGAEKKSIGVLPFAVHSSEDLDYVKSGIWDMLISRLSASGEISVLDKLSISNAANELKKKELTASDAYGIGKTLGTDYVVWGSITKIGNSISLDGKLLDVSTYKMPVGIFEQCRGMDDVIPKINDFANKINQFVLGKKLSAPTLPEAPQANAQRQEPEKTTSEGAIDALKTQEGTFTSIINPSFITTTGVLDRKGFFMTPRYSRNFKGMDIGDVDGDTKNEVVLIDYRNVLIYRKEVTGFTLLSKITGKSSDRYLALDVADINGNGIDEIIVTNFQGSTLRSFVVEFKESKYQRIAEDLPWFLRVISTSEGIKLVGQELGLDKPFSNPISEILWNGDGYREGQRMSIPEGLSVYGMTMASIDGGNTERVIALDEYDHLNIYKKTKKPVSRIHVIGGGDDVICTTDEVYGGTNNRLDYISKSPGFGDEGIQDNVYVNVRILTYDIKGDGKQEIVIVKNLSPAGRLFKNVRLFSNSEIYNLEWDGLGLIQNWKTRKIQGYVADYQFKDIDNDGQNEIVLAVALSHSKSVVVAYDLIVQ